MHVGAARNDAGFLEFQQNHYQKLADETNEQIALARESGDADLEDHLADLTGSNLMRSEWKVDPMYDITEDADFVNDLLMDYLDEIRVA